MSAIIKTLKTTTNDVEQSVYPKTVLEAVVDTDTNQTLDVILDNIKSDTPNGSAYVDFNEQSGEVTGEVEAVTSAKLVSYSNTESGIEATNVQDAIDTVSSISKGKNRARVFATTEDMNNWLKNEANKGIANVGDNLYIVALDVPDYWISAVLNEADTSTGMYYNIAQLETQKVDLTTIESSINNIENSLLTGKKDITGKDLYYDLGNIKESFLASGKNLTNAPIPDTENWDYIIQQARSNNNVMQFANLVDSPYDLFFRSFEVNDEHFDMSVPTDWVSLSAGQSLKNSFVKYNSNEAGTIFGTPISGPGLYFFTIIESISSTNRSNPIFGTMYVDSNYQSWISFQKGTNSVITDIKYYDNYNDLAYDQMVITLSANRYVSVFTLKLDGCCNESELNKLS